MTPTACCRPCLPAAASSTGLARDDYQAGNRQRSKDPYCISATAVTAVRGLMASGQHLRTGVVLLAHQRLQDAVTFFRTK